jgi:hypothetical protein
MFCSSLPPEQTTGGKDEQNIVNKTGAFLQTTEVKTDQTNTTNVNKTWALLQTTEVKTNQTNTTNVNKTWALLQTTEVKTNETNTTNVIRHGPSYKQLR